MKKPGEESDLGAETERRKRPETHVSDRATEWLQRALGLGGAQTPFPWQLDLLRRLQSGEHVQALDIPTGLGKTATMAIWLVARSLGASLPRRLVYVVDRRAVVDQATQVAEDLRAWVRSEPDVADALGLVGRDLPISTLRGQHIDNREWLEDPASPAIVVGTVDMIGSRLLFEGYRCSRRMRPYHAALLGADALLVLDEAHLVPAFDAMVRVATDHEALRPQSAEREVVPHSRVMSLSATGRRTASTLRLGDADLEHAVLKRRLDAQKRVRITESVTADALAKTLADKAWELAGNGTIPSRVIVFVTSRKTAQRVRDAIEKLAKGQGSSSRVAIETVLFVGGRRIAERQKAAQALTDLGVIASSNSRANRPVFVIATSAGEVGVDLDADHAVLDLVEWERMVQRLGRVNRRGEGEAQVWVVPPTLDGKTEDALAKQEKLQSRRRLSQEVADDTDDRSDENGVDDAEGKPAKRLKADERRRVERWRRLEATRRAIQRLPSSDGSHDASPRALTALKNSHATLIVEASTPAPLHPELTRAVVQSWSMTSLQDHAGRPGIRPWVRGWVEEEAQTTLAWRTSLPTRADAMAFFEAAPVQTAESLEIDSTIVLDWLAKRARAVARANEQPQPDPTSTSNAQIDTETEGEAPPLASDDVVMFVLDEHHRGWTLAELTSFDKKQLLRELSGETLVFDTRFGGLDETGLLDPRSDGATDVSDSGTMRLPFRVRKVETLESLAFDEHWRVEATFVSRANGEGEPIAWLVVETDRTQPSTTADGRSTGREQTLAEHQAFAERHARSIGERAGMAPAHVDLLALAAVLHDEGKKAERWQNAFRASPEKRPLGKTTSRPLQAILARYRHEFGSLPYAERDPRVAALSPNDRDLVLHMIAAHHGFARPILRTDGCDAPPSALAEQARTIALRFARLEKRWGPWGLAWWETLLRAADQRASRENDERGGASG